MIPGRVMGVAVDLVFVTLGLVAPGIIGSRLWRRQAAWRYRRLAVHYNSRVIAQRPGYSAPLEAALERLFPPWGLFVIARRRAEAGRTSSDTGRIG